jgi:hypothetical protein
VDAYQRVDGKGFAIVWRVASLDEARERISQLKLPPQRSLSVEFAEVAPV